MDWRARLRADNDQERAEFEDWWRATSDADKLRVLEAIQRHYDDPVVEIMSRLAQLAFSELCDRLGFEGED